MNSKLQASLLIVLVCFVAKIKAQEPLFKEKDLVVTAGYGFPDFNRLEIRRYYSSYHSSNYDRTVRGFGPLLLKADYGVYKFDWGHTLGVGGVFGFSRTTVKEHWLWWNGSQNEWVDDKSKYTSVIIGARGTYHFYGTDKLDCYGALGFGYSIGLYHHTTTNSNASWRSGRYGNAGLYETLVIGARYYFNEHIGVYGEAGWDAALLQLGIAIKP